MTLATAISIWVLSAACIANAIHTAWVFRRCMRLSRRVHHLEMERDFPGYTREHHEVVHHDQWDH